MKKRRIMGGLMALLILLTAGCGQEPQEVTDQSVSKPESKQVVEAFGTVKCTDVKNIMIDYPAAVAEVKVVEGQGVKAGDVLVTLDSRSYTDLIKSQELDLKSLQLELAGFSRDYETKKTSLENSSDPEISRYINDKNHAQNEYEQALEDLAAREVLYNSGALSLSELNEFKASVQEKKKAVEDAVFLEENTRKTIQSELGELQTSMEQKKVQISTKELELAANRGKMNKSYIQGNAIVADMANGVVTDIDCAQGDFITEDQGKRLLTVLNKDSLEIEADVAEEFIKDVKLGAEVTINPQADKSLAYHGKVVAIAEKVVEKDNETIIPVRISVENTDSFLRPEFNVDVQISF